MRMPCGYTARCTTAPATAVPDALVELWQPDGAGRIPRATGSLRRDGSAGFTGFGRAATDADGQYGFTTVTPGVASRRRKRTDAARLRGILRLLAKVTRRFSRSPCSRGGC